MQTLILEGTVRALSSVTHNGGASYGISSKLRREKFVQPDGSVEEVPVISGNALRGVLRDRSMLHMCRLLGYGVDEENGQVRGLSLPAFYFLFSGGALTNEGGKTIDIERARHLRELIPLVGIFGGALGKQILPGKLKVGKMIPICQEVLHLLPEKYQQPIPSIWEYLQEEMYTRKDDAKNEHYRPLIEQGQQPLLIPGDDAEEVPAPEIGSDIPAREGHKQQMMYYCITGDTPVMLADGRRLDASHVYAEVTAGKGIEVLAYDFQQSKFVPAKVQDAKTWSVEQTISLKTARGYELTGTLDHKMLTWGDGGLMWKSLEDIKVGDSIAASSQLPIYQSDIALNPIRIHAEDCAIVSEALALKLRDHFPLSVVYRSGNIKRAKKIPCEVGNHPFAVRMPTIQALLDKGIISLNECREHLRAILPTSRSNGIIKPQWELVPAHLTLLGLFLSDGSMSKDERRFHFASIQKNERSRFRTLMFQCFGIEPSSETTIGLGYSRPLLCRFFKEVFGVSGGRKARTVRIPSLLFRLPLSYQQAFLDAYQCGDGTTYRMTGKGRAYGERNVICTSSRQIAIDFVYLLSSLGFTPTIAESPERKQTFGTIQMYRVEWSMVSTHKQYLPTHIGSPLVQYRQEHQLTRQAFALGAGVHVATIRAFEEGRYSSSRHTVEAIEKATGLSSGVTELPLTWVRIKEIRLNETSEPIYAFDVEKHHNFLCGTGPLVSHNCETFAAGTPFYWRVTLDDVTDIEFESFIVGLAQFSRMPFIGGKSAVGLGEVAIKFDKWLSIDSRVHTESQEINIPLGQAYYQHLQEQGAAIRAELGKMQ